MRLVFQSSCACRTVGAGPIRPAFPASLGCQQRAIRLIVHGNTDETFQEEKNTGLGNRINIINHGQESAINSVCFLLGADHRPSLCSRDGNERLSWCCCQWDPTRVQSKVSRHVWLSTGSNVKRRDSSLSVKVAETRRHHMRLQVRGQNWLERRERRIRYSLLVVICTYQNEEVCVPVV